MSGKRLYTGDVPCPGCGRTYPECKRHYKESICFECERELRKFKEIKRRTQNQKESFVDFMVDDIHIPHLSTDDSYVNFYNSLRYLLELLDTPERDELKDGPLAKVRHGLYYNSSFAIGRGDRGYGNVIFPFVIREDIAYAVDAFLTCIEGYSHAVYLKGKREGANLLQRLGNQELSPDEFIAAVKSKV